MSELVNPFETTIPILRVENLVRSIEFYTQRLGFTVDWGNTEGSTIASVSRGRGALMLCAHGQGHAPTWVWIGVPDVQELYDTLRGQGVKIRSGPIHYQWAVEIQVEDPDGHILRLGSPPT